MQQIARIVSRRRSLSSGVPFTPDRFSVIGVRIPDGRRIGGASSATTIDQEMVLSAITIDELTIADEPARWAALGFDVADGECQIGSVRLRFSGTGKGLAGWSLRGAHSAQLDGLPTTLSARPLPPPAPAHPNGVLAIDHVVAASADLDRSIAALQAAGLDLRRVREQPTPGGAPRQAFFRLGAEILELIQEPAATTASSPQGERAGASERPVRFWGLALLVEDLDRTAALLARHLSDVRPAVQPGRRIASVRRTAGLAVPLALMSKDERAVEER
jgi:hypothetical protein